jgi:hypothetical protein
MMHGVYKHVRGAILLVEEFEAEDDVRLSSVPQRVSVKHLWMRCRMTGTCDGLMPSRR